MCIEVFGTPTETVFRAATPLLPRPAGYGISRRLGQKVPADAPASLVDTADMDELSQDEVFALAIIEITLDVLERMGDDPDMRFDFFRRFVALATELTEGSGAAVH